MDEHNTLKLIKIVFVKKNGDEIEKELLTDEEYRDFCNEMEKSRITNEVIWPEMDNRYKDEKNIRNR